MPCTQCHRKPLLQQYRATDQQFMIITLCAHLTKRSKKKAKGRQGGREGGREGEGEREP